MMCIRDRPRRDPAHGLQRVLDRHPELLPRDPGRDRPVRAGLHVGRHPHQHPLPGRRQRRDPVDLVDRVDHDPPHAPADGRLQVVGRLRVAVQQDPLTGEPRGARHGDLARRAHVQRQPLLADPPQHRPAAQRLPRVHDLGLRQHLPEPPAPRPHVGLVQQVARRPEARGHHAQRDPAHEQVARTRHRPPRPQPRSTRSPVHDPTLGTSSARVMSPEHLRARPHPSARTPP